MGSQRAGGGDVSNIFLNIGTAISDCQIARRAWLVDNYADCLVLINAAIAQLEAARAKIEKETKGGGA